MIWPPVVRCQFMSRTDASSVVFTPVAGKPGSTLGPVPQANKLWVQVIDTERGFDALEPAWTALYDEAGTSPFQTFAWQRAWWRHYAEPDPRMRLLVLAVCHEAADEESTVTAIAPFFIERRRAVGTLPMTRIGMIGRQQSDYLDLLVQSAAASAKSRRPGRAPALPPQPFRCPAPAGRPGPLAVPFAVPRGVGAGAGSASNEASGSTARG